MLIRKFSSLVIAARSSNVLAVSSESTDVMDQRPCEVGRQGCAGLPFPNLDWRIHAVEPRTGIEFPMVLDNILTAGNNSSLSSEVSTLEFFGYCGWWGLLIFFTCLVSCRSFLLFIDDVVHCFGMP